MCGVFKSGSNRILHPLFSYSVEMFTKNSLSEVVRRNGAKLRLVDDAFATLCHAVNDVEVGIVVSSFHN